MTKNRAAIAAIIVAASIFGPIGFVTPAYAHNVLIDSTPEAGETLTELPEQFSVTTNEAMLALPGSQGFVIQIQDADGAYYGDGCVEVVGSTMSATAAAGAPGEYTMLWQAVSADGHSIDGEIPFTWAPSADVDADAGSATPPVCGQVVSPTPVPTASATTPPVEPTPEAEPASGIDLTTVLWIAAALLALGIAAAVAIAIAGRRRSP